jgi:hypothetical protein
MVDSDTHVARQFEVIYNVVALCKNPKVRSCMSRSGLFVEERAASPGRSEPASLGRSEACLPVAWRVSADAGADRHGAPLAAPDCGPFILSLALMAPWNPAL